MGFLKQGLLGALLISSFLLCSTDVHHYEFFVREANFTKLCNTTTLLVVNGSYPGPEIRVHRGDTVFVNVHNQGKYGFTIHWHGIKQPSNPWSDGPEYITQCPILPGANFTYKVILSDEIGTLWWHAHSGWTRGSIHGAFIILPAKNEKYPFPTPDGEQTVILQSWYNEDYKQIIDRAIASGLPPRQPDAYAMSGNLGDTTGCPNDTLHRMQVDSNKTYLLRIINAGMSEERFFTITNHTLTVVAQDASYVKNFSSDYILVIPGQTMDVLLHANQNVGQYYMAMRPFSDAFRPVDLVTTGILQYKNSKDGLNASSIKLPLMNDTTAAKSFISRIKNINVKQNPPLKVPRNIDRRLYIVIATSLMPCPTCLSKHRIVSSLNNVSFVAPRIDILQAYYRRNFSGVFTQDFPIEPPVFYDLSGNLTGLNSTPDFGTRAVVLNYGEAIEIVFQASNLGGGGGTHPMHLHGFSFYWVGTGSGNFNNATDPSSYDLVNPPLINTVLVPTEGWVAIRFFATNPGVWFMHCHMERHSNWGMDTVFIVKNGETKNTTILPPPAGMPRCH